METYVIKPDKLADYQLEIARGVGVLLHAKLINSATIDDLFSSPIKILWEKRAPSGILETSSVFLNSSFPLSWERKVVFFADELEARFEQSFDFFWFLCHFHGELVASRLKHCPFDVYVYARAIERRNNKR